MKRVIALMGVNGTGKSTLAERIVMRLPLATIVQASAELRTLFGGITREQQNSMRIEDKMHVISSHLVSTFNRALDEHDYVIFDTQLQIPIGGKPRQYQCAWSDSYSRHIFSAIMLLAEPRTIFEWRKADLAKTGRERDLTESNIQQDQAENLKFFQRLIALGKLPARSMSISNTEGAMPELEDLVIQHITNSS